MDKSKPSGINKLFAIGLTPLTSEKEAERHRFLILMGTLMAGGGVLWGTIALMHELYLPSIIPYGYTVLTFINLLTFSYAKNFKLARFVQVLLSLCLPFMFQWSLGGFVSSGAIMFWAMIALAGAMLLEELKSSVLWLIAYILLVIFSSLTDYYFRANYGLDMPPHINTLFFAINIGVVSAVVFGLVFFFRSRLESREAALVLAHQNLQASEEELRQNTEELMSINEHLEDTQGELKKALKNEQEHKKVVEETNERLQATYQELLSSEKALIKKSELLEAVNENLEQTHQQLQYSLKTAVESKKALEVKNKELQEAQMQLVQSEKMASLGEMMAGIAHEINNPLNFISGGTQSLQLTINDLLEVLAKYQQLEHAEAEEEIVTIKQDITELKEELEYDELVEDISALLKDITSGSDRATEIVKSLKNFSRTDEDKLLMADLHEGIDSSLIILRNKLRDTVEIVKSYDEKIQQIECYPGQLNQVIMNLISNAIDAVEGSGKIEIITKNHDKFVELIIKDNGQGIPVELQQKIFDPFFTTKKVGEGTGLGLAICHDIIKKHEGRIELASAAGEGAAFMIKLPKLPSVIKSKNEKKNKEKTKA